MQSGCQKAVATVLRSAAALRSIGPLGSGFSITVESTVPVCQNWAPLMPAMTSSSSSRGSSSSNRKAFKTALTRFRAHSSAQRNSGSLLEYHLLLLCVFPFTCVAVRGQRVFFRFAGGEKGLRCCTGRWGVGRGDLFVCFYRKWMPRAMNLCFVFRLKRRN